MRVLLWRGLSVATVNLAALAAVRPLVPEAAESAKREQRHPADGVEVSVGHLGHLGDLEVRAVKPALAPGEEAELLEFLGAAVEEATLFDRLP